MNPLSRLGLALFLSASVATPSFGNPASLVELVCPCEIESYGSSGSVTFGLVNYADSPTSEMRVVVSAYPSERGARQLSVLRHAGLRVAEVLLDGLAAGERLGIQNYQIGFSLPRELAGDFELELVLSQRGTSSVLDYVRMADPVDLGGRFTVPNLDYLADADGDGVGDLNEQMANTDPRDPESTPGDVELDVLALYTHDFGDVYGDDVSAYIRHVVAVADGIFRTSETGIRLRVVGFQEIGADGEEFLEWGMDELRASYGADIFVSFRQRGTLDVCGFAPLIGVGERGYLSNLSSTRPMATIFAGCGGGVVAHEIGHILGLAHSNARVISEGTFRWSRGHRVSETRGTVMTYAYDQIDKFSDPATFGVPAHLPDGANAVASLNAVRFQAANLAPKLPDADGDGVVDPMDSFPLDPENWADLDRDRIPDSVDTDNDNDGVADESDAFPNDPSEWADADGDGVGDRSDPFPNDPSEWADADGDGVGDRSDPFPNDPSEWADTDGDGVGDRSDSDSDNDGIADTNDVFALDPTRQDLASYSFRGEQPLDGAGEVLAPALDVDGDGVSEFALGAPSYDASDLKRDAGAVYLVSSADMAQADAADGQVDRVVELRNVASQPNSWKIVGATEQSRAGSSVAIDDWNEDGRTDLVIGAAGFDAGEGAECETSCDSGKVYLIDGASLAVIDAADGEVDGVARLENVANTNTWLISSTEGAVPPHDTHYHDRVGNSVAITRDVDGGEAVHVIIGTHGYRRGGAAAYILPVRNLGDADAVDGTLDGIVELSNLEPRGLGSWRLVQDERSTIRSDGRYLKHRLDVDFGDVNGDGVDEILLSDRYLVSSGKLGAAAYVIATDGLSEADGADGQTDGNIQLSRVADGRGSWKVINSQPGLPLVGDLNGDRSPELIFGRGYHASRVIEIANIQHLDAVDGTLDGTLHLTYGLWRDYSPPVLRAPQGLTIIGDVDGNGFLDIGFVRHDYADHPSGVWSGYYAQLASWGDLVETASEGLVQGWQLNRGWSMARRRHSQLFGGGVRRALAPAGDVDGDGLDDVFALLSDSSSYQLGTQAPNEVVLVMGSDLSALDGAGRDCQTGHSCLLLSDFAGDDDGDGLLNSVDSDDDGDGFDDRVDAFPLDASEWQDSDGDGRGDNFDDDDGDGVPFSADAFPDDPREHADHDSDGIGNNADQDDDGDGVDDTEDAFPLDPEESTDSDGDGVGDNTDVFPRNAAESGDLDGDGIGDNADLDDDGDGVADAEDAFPLDSSESRDSDGDGVGNNADVFPRDPSESADFDDDGVGDNADLDDDNDGVVDDRDLFPLVANKSRLNSFRIVGEEQFVGPHWVPSLVGDGAGEVVSLSSYRGKHRIFVGSPQHPPGGALYAISAEELGLADARDGRLDREIHLGNIAALPSSWKLVGRRKAFGTHGLGSFPISTGDFDGDGKDDLAFSDTRESVVNEQIRSSFPLTIVNSDVATFDGRGRSARIDGVIEVTDILAVGGAKQLFRREYDDTVVASQADVDNDGRLDLLLGAHGGCLVGWPGDVDVVQGSVVAAVDAYSNLWQGLGEPPPEGVWRFVGEAAEDGAGYSTDFVFRNNMTGRARGAEYVIIGAPFHLTPGTRVGAGAVYLWPAAALKAMADEEDARTIPLGDYSHVANAWKMVGGGIGHKVSSIPDLGGDEIGEFLISGSEAYLVLSDHLLDADRADGRVDSLIDLDHTQGVVAYRFVGGSHARAAGDFDADGVADLVFRGPGSAVHLVSGADLQIADAADGLDGVIFLGRRAVSPRSYTLTVAGGISQGETFVKDDHALAVGDFDSDGYSDIVLGLPGQWGGVDRGEVYLVSGIDLPFLDSADGLDGKVDLGLIVEPRARAIEAAEGASGGGTERPAQTIHTRTIPTQSLSIGTEATLDLSLYFGNGRRFSVRSSDAEVVEANVTGSDLTLTPVAAGRAVVSVTAEEADGRGARQEFTVFVGLPFRDCAECPQLVRVPAGSFMMGAPEEEEGSSSAERPVHQVDFTAPFAIGVHEVTFAQWDACVAAGGCDGHSPVSIGEGATNPHMGRARATRPVVEVSWDDAQGYVAWLSAHTGETYRLPSEAEWEYAARAGTQTPFHFGATISTAQANFNGTTAYGEGSVGEARGDTLPVGSFPANAWGLHDVHGNAAEWTQDCYGWSRPTYDGAPTDGSAREEGDCAERVVRGGNWADAPRWVRSAWRIAWPANTRIGTIGIRVVRELGD